jgi:hypothetical protein
VVHISGKTVQELLDTIQSNDSLIVAKIKESENKPCKIRLKTIRYLIPKKITDKFNVKVDIPNKYKLVMHGKKNSCGTRRKSLGLSLLFYQIPLSSIKTILKLLIESSKFRFHRKYLHSWRSSKNQNDYRTSLFALFSKLKFFGKETFETKETGN